MSAEFSFPTVTYGIVIAPLMRFVFDNRQFGTFPRVWDHSQTGIRPAAVLSISTTRNSISFAKTSADRVPSRWLKCWSKTPVHRLARKGCDSGSSPAAVVQMVEHSIIIAKARFPQPLKGAPQPRIEIVDGVTESA